MSLRLPYELHEHILDLVSASLPGNSDSDTWRSTLISFALACKDFRDLAYPQLFRSVAFVFIKDLSDRHEVQSFPAPYRRKRSCFYRYVKTAEDIISLYLSGCDGIVSCIRQLSLHMDHPQLLEDSPLGYLSYHDLARIVKPLGNLQHIGLMGLVLDREDIVDPILPSLSELVVDHETCCFRSQRYSDCIRLSPTELYSLISLFGEIKHLVLNYVTLHDTSNTHGLVYPAVHSVTMGCTYMHPSSVQSLFIPLQFVPVESLRALHLTAIPTSTITGSSGVVSLSRCLTRIGPVLEHLTVGAILQGKNVFPGYNEIPNGFLSIDFRPCGRLHTVGISIQAPWADEYSEDVGFNNMILLDSGSLMRIIQRVVLQPLPPSVKTLKLTLRELLVCTPSSQGAAAARFWKTLEASLNTVMDKGVKRVEVITLKDSLGATPCTDSEQECLKAYFPRLVQRGAIFFPEDTSSHHSGRSISTYG